VCSFSTLCIYSTLYCVSVYWYHGILLLLKQGYLRFWCRLSCRLDEIFERKMKYNAHLYLTHLFSNELRENVYPQTEAFTWCQKSYHRDIWLWMMHWPNYSTYL
jgi:hypothetical protein